MVMQFARSFIWPEVLRCLKRKLLKARCYVIQAFSGLVLLYEGRVATSRVSISNYTACMYGRFVLVGKSCA